MTQLETKLKQAMIDAQWGAAGDTTDIMASAAASVAKKYIDKAIVFGIKCGIQNWDEAMGFNSKAATEEREQWLKSNGITE